MKRKKLKNSIIRYTGRVIIQETDKYFDKNNLFINLLNTGIVLDSKRLYTISKRYLKAFFK
jgi:hypothetical protein